MGIRVRVEIYVQVRVAAADRSSAWVRAKAASVEGEDEALLSDKLIDALW